jgi:hypothetical protein
MDRLTPEKAEELKAQLRVSQLLELEAPTGEVAYFRPPGGAVWRRFLAQGADERKQEVATENLVRGCLVHPDQASFNALLEDRPGLVQTFGVTLVEHAGASAKGAEKKVL